MKFDLMGKIGKCLSSHPSYRFTAREIAREIFSDFPDECEKKRKASKAPDNNDDEFIDRLASEINAVRLRLNNFNPRIKTRKHPAQELKCLYYWDPESDISEEEFFDEMTGMLKTLGNGSVDEEKLSKCMGKWMRILKTHDNVGIGEEKLSKRKLPKRKLSKRLSRYFLPILRETPAEAGTVAHGLMLRAGMIRQAASGLYSWLPLGYRVLRRIEEIVHDEQQRAGAVPLLMPTVQPADLWRESGRYDDYGEEMLRIRDRHGRDLLYGPTNEEMITDIVRGSLTSYRDLPKILYHIQWKFRDEIRPRFGIMRAREFLMKDAYSFDVDTPAARHSYNRMFVSYLRTFARMGLTAVPVRADPGPIGGDMTHEFLVLAETGESEIFVDSRLLDVDPIGEEIDFEDAEALERIVRERVSKYARTDETHDAEVFEREVPSDFRRTARAIEVGHVFHFADKYSRPMQGRVATEEGGEVPYQMGSYGIGISRLVGALIEASHDERGIIWPEPVAPFQVGLINLSPGNLTSEGVCDEFYSYGRKQHGLDILYDDTNRRAGAKYAAMELIGLPWRVAIGPRDGANGRVELVRRATGASETLLMNEAFDRIRGSNGGL